MNSIFGDASTIAPTPETIAEAESIFSGHGPGSPRSFSLGGDEQVPSMSLQPPDVEIQDGKPVLSKDDKGEGVGGWISNVVKRARGDEANGSGSGKYKRVGQDDEQ